MEGFPEELRQKLEPTGTLGEGAMGRVFRARDRLFERDVAVKVVLASDDAKLRARFEREARLLSAISHPNVLQLYDFGVTARGETYLVTQLVEGKPLAELLPYPDPVPLALQVMDAFEAMHAKGLIHRDVKPDNLMVRADGHPVLIDFGLARGEDSKTLTKTGAMAGTLPYFPPEMFRGEPASPAGDWYALGICLFQCLEGRHPHTMVDLLAMVDGKPPSRAAFRKADAAHPAARLALAMLEPDPARRLTSRAAASELLRRPPEARRGSPAEGPEEASRVMAGAALVRDRAGPAGGFPEAGPAGGAPVRRWGAFALVAGLAVLAGGWALSPGPAGPPPPSPPAAVPPASAVAADAPDLEAYTRATAEEMARTGGLALEGHGELRERVLEADVVADFLDPADVAHLDGLGWMPDGPADDRIPRYLSALTAWMRRLRDWEHEAEGARAFGRPEVRARFSREAFGTARHLLLDLRVGNVEMLGTAIFQSGLQRVRRRLVDDLVADLLVWPEDATPPQVYAFETFVRAIQELEPAGGSARLVRCGELLRRAEDPVVVRDLARAMFATLAVFSAGGGLPGEVRWEALRALASAPTLDDGPEDRLHLARVAIEAFRSTRLGADPGGEGAKILDVVLDRLAAAPTDPDLYPRLLAHARRVAVDDLVAGFPVGSQDRVRPLLAVLEARAAIR